MFFYFDVVCLDNVHLDTRHTDISHADEVDSPATSLRTLYGIEARCDQIICQITKTCISSMFFYFDVVCLDNAIARNRQLDIEVSYMQAVGLVAARG